MVCSNSHTNPKRVKIVMLFYLCFSFADSKVETVSDGETASLLAQLAPVLITGAFWLFFQILAFIFFMGRRQKTKMSRSRKNKM